VTDIVRPHFNILPHAQRTLWPQLGSVRELGFILYGGTAVALQLGHRSSLDFDFFSERPLHKDALPKVLPFLKTSQVVQDQVNTLTVLVYGSPASTPVKVSFFGGIDHGRVGTPAMTEDGVLEIASLDDLMATKLKVILQRLEAKDYQDIAAMLQAGQPLEQGLAAARTLYGSAFQPSESLKALVYFEGGDLATLPEETKTVLIQASSGIRSLPDIKLRSKYLSART
jgi:hypothetical protein